MNTQVFNPADGASCGARFGLLAVLVMALAVIVPRAAAILRPVLLLMDLRGMAAFHKSLGMKRVKFRVSLGRLGTPMGATLFRLLDAHMVAGMAGLFTMLFLAQQRLFPPGRGRPTAEDMAGRYRDGDVGLHQFCSPCQWTATKCHVILLRLSPLQFSVSMALIFFIINLSKWIPYGLLSLLHLRNMATSLVMLPLALVGEWVGVRTAKRTQPDGVFYTAVDRHVFCWQQTAVRRFSVKTGG